MYYLLEPFADIRDFLERGGWVLWVILFVTVLLWTLILERYWYLKKQHPRYLATVIANWKKREDTSSWYAHKIREALISEVSQQLNKSLLLIKTIIALCPLLGLLGTVTGIIHVFDVMAVMGTGNARAMASGISMATIPTMAGMMTALSGYFFSASLVHHAAMEKERAADLLRDYRGEEQ